MPTEPVSWADTKLLRSRQSARSSLRSRRRAHGQAGDDGIRFLLVSGKAARGTRRVYGPIVMNTQGSSARPLANSTKARSETARAANGQQLPCADNALGNLLRETGVSFPMFTPSVSLFSVQWELRSIGLRWIYIEKLFPGASGKHGVYWAFRSSNTLGDSPIET